MRWFKSKPKSQLRAHTMVLLTPGDIRNQKFQTSQLFRDGYNADEVDDFLDVCAYTVNRLALTIEALAESNSTKDVQINAARIDAAHLRNIMRGNKDD